MINRRFVHASAGDPAGPDDPGEACRRTSAPSEAPIIVSASAPTTPGIDPVEILAPFLAPFLAVEGWGLVVLVGAVAIWPLAAWLVVVVRRRPWQSAWRTFAGAVLMAVGFSVLAAGYAIYLLATNGTSRSMASLGPQIAAGLALLGGLVSGLIAIVLRGATVRSGTSASRSGGGPGQDDGRP